MYGHSQPKKPFYGGVAADPGFPGGAWTSWGGVGSQGGYILKILLCQNERIWTFGGVHRTRPLDPRMRAQFYCEYLPFTEIGIALICHWLITFSENYCLQILGLLPLKSN